MFTYHSMEIRQLEAFVQVVELGSFTRAATVLDSDQPALSRLVRQLEVELRQTLLHRHGRGVTATDAGHVLLGHAKGILQQAERAVHDLQKLRGGVSGHFSIGLAPSFAKLATQTLIRSFRQRFPEATISVTEGLSSHLSEWLTLGRIDAAVLYDTQATPLIEKRPGFSEPLFLIGPDPSASTTAPLGPRVPLARIGAYPLLIPGRMHAMRRIVESRAAEAGVKLNIALEVDAVGSILDLVQDGYGYAVLPRNAVNGDALRRRFQTARIVQPALHSTMVLATSTQHTLSRLAAQALEMVASEVLPFYTARRRDGAHA